MKDPGVWGEDAEDFKPERMLDGKFEALPVCCLLVKVPFPFPALKIISSPMHGSLLDTV
jgi:hypothetical protein